MTQLNDKQVWAIFERGNNFIRLGNLVAAINDYDQVLQHKPDFVPAYFNRGFARQHGRQDIPGAIADYTTALDLKPDFAEAYANRAIAHKQAGELDRALADYGAALRVNPQYAQAYNNRAEIYFLRGNFAAALADFEQAHIHRPGYRFAIAGQAIACHALGEVEQARRWWASLPQPVDVSEFGWDAALVAEAEKLLQNFGAST